MSTLHRNSRPYWQLLPVAVVVAALGLAGCGGSDDNASESTGSSEPATSETSDRSEDVDVPEPVAVLPFEVETPAEFRALSAKCDPGGERDPDRSSDSSTDDSTDDDSSTDSDSTDSDSTDSDSTDLEYATWITYAVPEKWESGGRGSAGSGGVMSTDEDRSFRFDDEDGSTGSVSISIDWDNRNSDGEITDGGGGVWESFDFDSTSGDDETTITFDNVGTVTAGDQTADLFYRDPAQAPDHISGTEYKIRLEALELPQRQPSGDYELVPQSFVMTVSFDEEDASIDQETIEQIVGSTALPECSWDRILSDYELILNVDLDGDGEIRDADDVREELEGQLDQIQSDLKKDVERELEEEQQKSAGG